MGGTAKQVIDSIKELSLAERAVIAQLLIASLDESPDANAEAQWISIAEERLAELESGKVQGVRWEQIKRNLKRI